MGRAYAWGKGFFYMGRRGSYSILARLPKPCIPHHRPCDVVPEVRSMGYLTWLLQAWAGGRSDPFIRNMCLLYPGLQYVRYDEHRRGDLL